MAGERTPDTTPPGKTGSSDDDISLREHLQRQLDTQGHSIHRRIDELIARLDERYDRQKAESERITSEQHAALDKAERAIEKRFDSVNEFRAQLNDQAHSFMPRTESISRHERTQEQLEKMEQHFAVDIASLNRRLDTQQGVIQGQAAQKIEGRQSNAALYAFIGAAVAVLSAVVIIANLLSNTGG